MLALFVMQELLAHLKTEHLKTPTLGDIKYSAPDGKVDGSARIAAIILLQLVQRKLLWVHHLPESTLST